MQQLEMNLFMQPASLKCEPPLEILPEKTCNLISMDLWKVEKEKQAKIEALNAAIRLTNRYFHD